MTYIYILYYIIYNLIIHVGRIFHYKPSSYWGIPISEKLHIYYYIFIKSPPTAAASSPVSWHKTLQCSLGDVKRPENVWLVVWLVESHGTPNTSKILMVEKKQENYILSCLPHFRELGHSFMINHDKSASLEETHLAEKCWLWLGGYCNPFWIPSINQPRYQAFQHVYVSCVETTLIRWQKWDSWIANPQLEFNCRMSVGNTF